jgi:hypothetical protein
MGKYVLSADPVTCGFIQCVPDSTKRSVGSTETWLHYFGSGNRSHSFFACGARAESV